MRFTIRDVLWLTALVAVLTAWGVDRWVLAAQSSARGAAWRNASEENYKLRELLTKASPGWDYPTP